MSVPKDVSRLIEKFDQHLESYRSGKYNEAQLRNEFLNPLFIDLVMIRSLFLDQAILQPSFVAHFLHPSRRFSGLQGY